MKTQKIILFLLLSFYIDTGSIKADPIITIPKQSTLRISNNFENPPNNQMIASMWGLTIEEYQHYLWLMKNTPSGHWYKDLDPAEVSGLNANNYNEMMQYAILQAQLMHQRVEKELQFNLIYSKAYREQYPNEKPITSHYSNTLLKQTLQPGDRIWLFIKLNTPLSSLIYQKLKNLLILIPHIAIDIYFVGNNLSKTDIQKWAIINGILPNSVSKQVTLNYGNEQFKLIAHEKNLSLPLVGIVHDSQFQPLTLPSIFSR